MKISQHIWNGTSWNNTERLEAKSPQVILLFGSRPTIEASDTFIPTLREKYPTANLVTCSSAGNIIDESLVDDQIIATCIELEKTTVDPILFPFENKDGEALGIKVAKRVAREDLCYVLVLSTAGINAGNLLKGMNKEIQGKTPISGGVAGDDERFETTLIGLNEDIGTNRLVAIPFYGKNLHTEHGSRGGWDTFGPRRIVTKAEGNVLYTIDDNPVLDLYKTYLGEMAEGLPATGLHFPLAVINLETDEYVVRGIQNIDEEKNALILYGDVEEGQTIQLMRANFDRVIDAANDSAKEATNKDLGEPDLSILISCVARRLVLDQLTEEELSEARKALGAQPAICGFYSYSEISPVVGDRSCHIHNQTMTITSLFER